MSETGFEFDVRDELGIYLRNGHFLSFGDAQRGADGFSPMTSVVFFMEGTETAREYPGNYFDLTGTQADFANTVLIDIGTQQPVEHFFYKKGDLVYLQPVNALSFNTRYVRSVLPPPHTLCTSLSALQSSKT